ncbi:MAG: hypothetical protein ACRDDY_19220 [Clostridium sp.]|uniref:hypothetical protein n=1 Tax=Clostridium sp. TaxID=1506 RepID=UPI003EE7F958
MKLEKIKELFLVNDHGVFPPNYKYKGIDYEMMSYIGFEIVNSAQEVYDEWLINKYKPTTITPTDAEKIITLEKENKQLWDTIEYLLKVAEQI